MPQQCTRCDAPLKPGSRFCGKCGSQIPTATPRAPISAVPTTKTAPPTMTQQPTGNMMEDNIRTLQEMGYRKEPRVSCLSCQRSMTFVRTETRQGVEKRGNVAVPVARNLTDILVETLFLFLAGIVRQLFFPPKKLTVETDSFICSFCGHRWKSNERVQQAK